MKPGLHPLELEPEHVERVGPLDRIFDARQDGDAELCDVVAAAAMPGPQTADLGAQLGKSPDVAPGHPAMQDVTTDRHLESLDPLEPVAQRQHVQQSLGRVLVLSVARIDHVGADPLAQELGRAGGAVPDDHHVDPHCLEVPGGIHQGLALADRASRRRRR